MKEIVVNTSNVRLVIVKMVDDVHLVQQTMAVVNVHQDTLVYVVKWISVQDGVEIMVDVTLGQTRRCSVTVPARVLREHDVKIWLNVVQIIVKIMEFVPFRVENMFVIVHALDMKVPFVTKVLWVSR
jgi:hypothetical protein